MVERFALAAPSGAAANREGEAGSRAAALHGWLLGSVLRRASGALRRRCESRGRGRKPSGCAPWMAAWLGSSSRQRRVPAPLRIARARQEAARCLQRVGWTRVCAAGCAAHCRPICDRPAYQIRSAARKKTARFPAPFLHSIAMTKAAVTPPSSPRADATRPATGRLDVRMRGRLRRTLPADLRSSGLPGPQRRKEENGAVSRAVFAFHRDEEGCRYAAFFAAS